MIKTAMNMRMTSTTIVLLTLYFLRTTTVSGDSDDAFTSSENSSSSSSSASPEEEERKLQNVLNGCLFGCRGTGADSPSYETDFAFCVPPPPVPVTPPVLLIDSPTNSPTASPNPSASPTNNCRSLNNEDGSPQGLGEPCVGQGCYDCSRDDFLVCSDSCFGECVLAPTFDMRIDVLDTRCDTKTIDQDEVDVTIYGTDGGPAFDIQSILDVTEIYIPSLEMTNDLGEVYQVKPNLIPEDGTISGYFCFFEETTAMKNLTSCFLDGGTIPYSLLDMTCTFEKVVAPAPAAPPRGKKKGGVMGGKMGGVITGGSSMILPVTDNAMSSWVVQGRFVGTLSETFGDCDISIADLRLGVASNRLEGVAPLMPCPTMPPTIHKGKKSSRK